MKPSLTNRFRIHAAIALPAMLSFALPAGAADRWWDGGTTNIATNGDGASTYTSGTWNTSLTNWDQGAGQPRLAWNNANLDTAIFAGTYSAGTKTVTIGSNITVNQIQVLTGSTGGNRYDFGASNAQNDFAITFGGTYDADFPAITGNSSFVNTNFNAKITGTISGGLVLKHGTNITVPGTTGRFAFTNGNNDFIGNVVVAGGNLAFGGALGNVNNKIVLSGGALFAGIASNYNITTSREIVVDGTSGIGLSSTGSNNSISQTGALSGSGDLILYSGGAGTFDFKLQGSMADYTGTFDIRGKTVSIETPAATAPSGGAWKVTGGTLKLNAADDTHIANGAGMSGLLMNGGTLDMNGKSETINALSGATGTVRNNLAATTSTLTVGDADTSAIFGGTLTDGSGTLALTKTGTGTQTLGDATHFGATLVEGGTLAITGSIPNSPITVKDGAKLTLGAVAPTLESLALEGGAGLQARLDAEGLDVLHVWDTIALSGGTVTLYPVVAGYPALGTYPFATAATINGSATLVADFSANGLTRVDGTAAIVGNSIEVTITQSGADLTWNNAAGNGLWNLDGPQNFLNGAVSDRFLNGDRVAFGATSPGGTITLEGTLLPAAVSVDSDANFLFTGDGSISGTAALTKNGSGTLTIENSNTLAGAVTVANGTLTVNGSLGGGGVKIDPGATLRGTGTLAGEVTIDELDGLAATVAPGTAAGTIGTLATGSLTLWGNYDYDIDGASSDLIAVTGSLALDPAALAVNFVSPSTAVNHPLITYTGTLSGAFAPESIPAGWEVDYSQPGRVVLWPASTPPTDGTITFETLQGYPDVTDLEADKTVAGINTDPNGAAFSGVNGWSLSTSNNVGMIHAATSNGEYRGGQAIGANSSGTYIGGKLGAIQRTGANTIVFDAPFYSGTSVGLFRDLNGDGLFLGGETSMAFGVGGSPARFQSRNAAFGTENFGAGFTGTAGQWYRFQVSIGASVGGERAITMAVRNLTTGEDFDFDAATEGIQPWSFTVTDAQFGAAPELSDGIFVRTSASARIDNLRVTSVEPPAAGTYAGWANLHGVTGAMDDDDDLDGVPNGIEFFMGEDSNGFTATPVPDGNRKVTWTKGADYDGAYGAAADFVVETSPDLAAWTPVPALDVADSPAGVAYTLPAGEGKIFARLKVMGPE